MENNKTIYSYKNKHGKELFRKIRIQYPNGSKSFHSEHDKNGIIINNLDGCQRVLYRLPEILEGISKKQPIFLVEGEKDVETLIQSEKYKIYATTTLATTEWRDEYTETLKDADVIILYDNDKTGIQRKEMLIDKLYGNVKSLKIIDLPNLEYSEKHGLDITDWLEMGHSIEELVQLVKSTTTYTPSNELKAVTLDELFELNLSERKMIFEPFIPSQGLVMIVARRGVGKTHVALGIACAIATGGSFLKWIAPEAKSVLYLDGEMPAIQMKERLKFTTNIIGKPVDSNFFKLITPDLQTQNMPDLATKEGRDSLEKFIQECDIIIIDNISTLFRSGSENEAESWQQAQEWALSLRRQGKSILFVHHAGKNGAQRGTSKREDILDSVIQLKHPSDYKPDQGARFEILFDKARDFSGNNATAFEAWLKEKEDGVFLWEISDISAENRIQQIADLKNSGMTIEQIEKKENITKSQVETFINKAKKKGLIIEKQKK